MDPRTRRQLLELSETFYQAHAAGFDASRGHQPWPGWTRMADALAERLPGASPAANTAANTAAAGPLRVLDVGCGNARLARFLADAGHALDYLGVDANAALLDAARTRLPVELAARCRLVQLDFLAPPEPGSSLPEGPFDLVALMGVLHHVPGQDWRTALLRAAAVRLAPRGLLALATWQFAGRPRFTRREVDWRTLGPVAGEPIDPSGLEDGDHLLGFGDDPTAPPRYCHQVSEDEFASWPEALGLEPVDRYLADGAEADLNRYWLLRKA